MDLTYRESAREQALAKLVKGFLFIPICIALLGAVGAVLSLYVDSSGLLSGVFDALGYETISNDGARSVLSTIAGAMMSVISLVYSLTLVVFTLAAGNISARLLETFASNRTTQFAIGILGATFLYSLFVLFVVDENRDVRFSVVMCIALAATSFFWLVYFVNDVAGRIRVDTEIGRIQGALRRSIDALLEAEPREKPNDRQEIPDLPATPVRAHQSGYVTSIDTQRLISHAKDVNGFVEVLVPPGTFVIQGMPIAEVRTRQEQPDSEHVHLAFRVGKARAPEGDIQFSVHLMVEIALRALSPGINDSYTAISAIDHLSASFARILQRGVPSSLLNDSDGEPRVWLNLLEVREILDTALNPLRQSAKSNVLVLDHLIQALEKTVQVCRPEHLPLVKRHLLDIACDARQVLASKPDRAQIAARLNSARKATSRKAK
ncbi:DUF2254 domain-containing protein [Roseibium aggregatum]|uniref:DUF2254 domain-containing protein n=1 Tax=Roseibium aggregatum TaxID=187304 RepID=A0A939EB72_9HYPH|nr:DUF2254 domain-containing protein [Roseibium aggregatum]MBN9669412.1 DUF2254 domain-containing protein [Roseibium aggregatum]